MVELIASVPIDGVPSLIVSGMLIRKVVSTFAGNPIIMSYVGLEVGSGVFYVIIPFWIKSIG